MSELKFDQKNNGSTQTKTSVSSRKTSWIVGLAYPFWLIKKCYNRWEGSL